MSDLEQTIWTKYADAGVRVYGIYENDDPALVAQFAEANGITFPLVKAPGTSNLFAFPAQSVIPFPRQVVVGPDGAVQWLTSELNIAELDALLAGMVGAADLP